MFKTLFYLQTCNQRFREQMAGVFTLNTKLIQSCFCAPQGCFTPAALGFCCLLSLITILLSFSSIPPPPCPFQTFSTSMCPLVFHLDGPSLRSAWPVNALFYPLPYRSGSQIRRIVLQLLFTQGRWLRKSTRPTFSFNSLRNRG